MSSPADPLLTTTFSDLRGPASNGHEDTEAAAAPGDAPVPGFGPPAVNGEVGTLGPYRVLKQLGRGGMGAVYLALDPRLDRQLALKVMLPEFAANNEARERFLREARAAAKVSHDNAVTVFEADMRDGVPYIAMQFLQGYPLDEYLKKKGAPPLEHVIRIGREAALGLDAAHKLGLVHRDIKPANLWLEAPNGRVKVLDFGLAKPISSETELTKIGEVRGTPAYMSPEQARGLVVDHRADLYSLGAVLYRLCTGKTPFNGPNLMSVLMALGTEDPEPVRELNPNVPPALAELIHRLLAKKPDDRPQTAVEVAKRLRGILDQLLAPSAQPGGASDPPPVVVHALPYQPPELVPMSVTAGPAHVFANLGADDGGGPKVTEAGAAPAAPRLERKTGGAGVWVAAGVAVALLAVTLLAAGAVFLSKRGNSSKPDEDVSGKTGPRGPGAPAEPLPATYKNGIGMEFVKVPRGTAWFGGGGGRQGETKVDFRYDFYLGKYEVTQEEWKEVMGQTPSHFSRAGRGKDAVKDVPDDELKRFPVEMVSWDDCQKFVVLLNEKEPPSGWVYRLPKQNEWEYACRGGPVAKAESAFDFYFAKPSNTMLPEQANVFSVLGRTCKVGSYESNPLGLYDMHGNVLEWCDDADLEAAVGVTYRAVRGGAWGHGSALCEASEQSSRAPSWKVSGLGFRLARVPSAMANK